TAGAAAASPDAVRTRTASSARSGWLLFTVPTVRGGIGYFRQIAEPALVPQITPYDRGRFRMPGGQMSQKVTSTASRTASVRTRLSAALGAVVVVAGAVIILAVQGVSALQTRQAQASQHALPYVSGLSDAALAAKAAATDERGFLMTGQAS